MKKLLTSILLFILLVLPTASLAQSPSPSASPQTEVVDVYALFWPVVPGKTVSDPMFIFKQLKEGFDGFFKSGNVAKAGFLTDISEKRLVEANKLIEDKDFTNALKSLKMNESNRNEAVRLKKKAAEEQEDVIELTTKMVKSLENQQKAYSYLLKSFPEDMRAEIQGMLDQLTLQISEAK